MFNKIPMKQAQSKLLDSTREQLTGLSDALRSRTIAVGADGVATTNVVSYDLETMVETSTTSSPAFGTRVTRSVCGLVLEEETADETIAGIVIAFNGNAVESIAGASSHE